MTPRFSVFPAADFRVCGGGAPLQTLRSGFRPHERGHCNWLGSGPGTTIGPPLHAKTSIPFGAGSGNSLPHAKHASRSRGASSPQAGHAGRAAQIR